MSAEVSGTRCHTGSPGRGSGRRPTSTRPSTTKECPSSKVTRQRGPAGWAVRAGPRADHRAARVVGRRGAGTGCWAGCGRAAAGPARTRAPGACGYAGARCGAAARCRGAAGGGGWRVTRRVGRGAGRGGGAWNTGGSTGRGGDEPHRGEVDDVARAVVDGLGDHLRPDGRRPRPTRRGGRASRVAGGRGPRRRSRRASPGRSRRSAARRRPARGSGPGPARPRSGCRCRGGRRAGPRADLPGVLPETPVITASTSQPSTIAPHDDAGDGQRLVAEQQPGARRPTATYRPQVTSRSMAKA